MNINRYCFSPSGGEVQFALEGSETHSEDDHDHSSDSTSATADATQAAASATGTSTSGAGENCHFHAGVEYGLLFLAYAGVLMYL